MGVKHVSPFSTSRARWALWALWALWAGRASRAAAADDGYRLCECPAAAPATAPAAPWLECRCVGRGPLRVPLGVLSLTLVNPGRTVLQSSALRPYNASLRDLLLTEAGELRSFAEDALYELSLLRSLEVFEAPALESLPDTLLNGVSSKFKTLRVIRTGLRELPRLRRLPPDLIFHTMDFESNHIHIIRSNTLSVRAELLILNYNGIETVEDWAFNGSEIAKLSFKGNRQLSQLSADTFSGLRNLRELELSETAITRLPTRGLAGLEVLRVRAAPSLTEIPSVYFFKHLREAWLTYSFHCCAFSFPARHDPIRHALYQEHLVAMQQRCRGNASAPRRPRRDLLFTKEDSQDEDEDEDESEDEGDEAWNEFGSAGGYEDKDGYDTEMDDGGMFHSSTIRPRRRHHHECGNMTDRRPVRCRPEPDALNPCEDIMGSTWLRVSVWFVLVTAVLGNAAVLLGLMAAPRALTSRALTPSKFLMCNLAFADLCMGLYLLLLASADAHSHGAYFNFAFHWQSGTGCRAAGFLTVFASQLSVYTLTALTVERWVAITYALYLNKRLTLRAAFYIMAVGWIYAIAMAVLPLVGVSSYAPTSICLPMETRRAGDMAYLVSLLAVNALAFGVVCACYVRIYMSLGRETRGAARRGELAVARRMALLVFTDFACWAPIAFFGLTAVAGYPLIDVTRSKILLVFFYPLNSCANPYLYALLTKQYRRDLASLLNRCGLCRRLGRPYKAAYSVPTTNQSQPHNTRARVPETTASRPTSVAAGATGATGAGNDDEASV